MEQEKPRYEDVPLFTTQQSYENFSPEQLLAEKSRLLGEITLREKLVFTINDVLDGYGVETEEADSGVQLFDMRNVRI